MPSPDPHTLPPANRKLLIVDDEPHLRALVADTLEDLEDDGVRLLTAADGEQALALIDEEHPALVILDVMIPRINGFEVCRQIRLLHPGVLVIMLTAKGQDLDRMRGDEVGADHYATKPFDPDELLEVSRRMLGMEKRSR